MIRKNLFFILSIVALSLGFTACLDGNNEITYRSFAVVDYNPNMKGATILTPNGELATSGLPSSLVIGDCVYAYYTIDYDNQPSSNYFTATDLQIPEGCVFDQTPIDIQELPLDLNDPSYNTEFTQVAPHTLYVFRGKIFFEFNYKTYSKQQLTYSLACNTEELAEKGSINLYLRGTRTGEKIGSEIATSGLHVFDAYNLIKFYGKDSTDPNDNSFKYKYLDVYIKYCNEIDEEEGKYEYKDVYNIPVRLTMDQNAPPFH